ncbi:MAG: bifunctional demethylmenaquinone methyltransferase/2-methoxy-6-polyprenyl-1,4-benzoquinol methylase UbiE [Proteobacteria bacterium]|nr:bifunctional demethylmenaquinone methyltransferase/2-methoxy-6-polyprenyl-1,4-benzoquinol methylase UbiE [Cystobacterineae bacterium]MCL2258933.1 bifunctional demethylmenaquinone methyltransferase/2-methoxy-6-polyprenyl-1,4-benzoquinol methylase UbiE [Cystobacterineae bacterium]MCL2314759.1 bifunctional demethylmenaquinone methyltransferase/2-methoxy-6-polyprenyl-1,4-benzoquinol methylase UbiE [Pseudomonadota bacterium]
MSESVRSMFSQIAPRYDLTNDVLSLGTHRYWRKKAVKLTRATPGNKVLDCATGTGDLALAFKRAVGPQGHVTGTDFCADMLNLAPAKAAKAGLNVHFEVADATALPYPDDSFDIVSISFGIRNVDNPQRCLLEMARVLKHGGRALILEFGQPKGLFGGCFRLYSKCVIPFIGKCLTGNRSAYEYLPKTSATFPSGKAFLKLMDETSAFHKTQAHPLSLGIAYAYVGEVSKPPQKPNFEAQSNP